MKKYSLLFLLYLAAPLFAAENGHTEIVQLLMDASANATIKDTAQKTPLDYASNDGIKKLLERKN